MTKALALRALDMAIRCERPTSPVIHHSDRGSQYASHAYQDKLQEHGVIPSMSRKGNCYDNTYMESFHSILKGELVYQKRFKTREQAKRRIWEYIELWYNRQRLHASLGYMTPLQFESRFSRSELKDAG
jgi:putative transposase